MPVLRHQARWPCRVPDCICLSLTRVTSRADPAAGPQPGTSRETLILIRRHGLTTLNTPQTLTLPSISCQLHPRAWRAVPQVPTVHGTLRKEEHSLLYKSI